MGMGVGFWDFVVCKRRMVGVCYREDHHKVGLDRTGCHGFKTQVTSKGGWIFILSRSSLPGHEFFYSA